MKKAGRSVIKITVMFAKLISWAVKLGFSIYTIKVAVSSLVMIPWVIYIILYFYSVTIQLNFTLDLSKMINKHRTKNPNNLGLVMSNLAEIRCMRLEGFMLS